jgi:PAS domain S-box-containing protein
MLFRSIRSGWTHLQDQATSTCLSGTMQPNAKTIRFWGVNRYVPLRYRFILLTSALLAVLMVSIIMVVSGQQSMMLREQVELRGLAIGQSLAATSKQDLITYNYIALSQAANQSVQNPDLVYVIIHDKEGRVAAYSGRPDLQGKFLQDPLTRIACASQVPLVQSAVFEESQIPVLDVAVPVLIPGSELIWGVVRVGLSLVSMQRRIQKIQLTIAGIGLVALCIAMVAYSWLVRRVTQPIARLVDATVVAAQGNLEQDIRINTRDEVEVLAQNFSKMIQEVLAQRQQLEQQLLEITSLQRYLNKLVTTMSDGLMSVDMEGRVVTLNPSAKRMLGLSDVELSEPRQIVEILSQAPEVLDYLYGLLGHRNSALQRELRVGQGVESKRLIVASSLLHDNRGQPQQVIVNLHDVTDLKKLEGRIRQAERLAELGTLAAGMAHEIRNPLSAIKTFVQLLPRKWDRPDFQEKFMRTVPRELERINRLIEDLLELARTPRYHFQLTDLAVFLRHAMELFEEDLVRHHIGISFDVPEKLPFVWADGDQLAKALNNLIQNAIQAMPEGGQLMVGGSVLSTGVESGGTGLHDFHNQTKRYLRLVIGDTGLGIQPEDLGSIFNPFFTTKDAGTGLGLAITHKVISEHGAHIEVESEVGAGTRFIITIPVTDPSQGDPGGGGGLKCS